jgi:hypothetical protein
MRQQDAPDAFPAKTDFAQAAFELPGSQSEIEQQPLAVAFEQTGVSAAAAGQYRPMAGQFIIHHCDRANSNSWLANNGRLV